MMSEGYLSLVPNAPSLEALVSTSALPPFDPAAIAFAEALSSRLLAAPEARRHPELVALAYWMRKANLKRLRLAVEADTRGRILVPRGVAFHIAPSNVDSIFVYSWFISLLAGNLNVIRLSSRESEQTRLLVDTLAALLGQAEHEAVARRTLLVRYDADPRVNAQFSRACQIRVIWGGDQTVARIREVPLPPTAIEVAFADKYSLALIDANAWLRANAKERKTAARAFFNDVFWFGQMACSSPRMVLWVGDRKSIDLAREGFWTSLEAYIATEALQFDAAIYVRKLLAVDNMAIEMEHVRVQPTHSNVLTRVWQEQPFLQAEHHCGHGLLLESCIDELDALRPILSRRIQTVSYYGFEQEVFRDFLTAAPVSGIDRIVPFGKALDFSPVWDGFDLFRTFTREITLS